MGQKGFCCGLCQRMTFLCFSLRVLPCHLTYRSLIHFESILCMMLGSVLISFFHIYLYSFPSTTYEEALFSPLCIFACFVIGAHRCPGLSLDFLSCSIGLYFCFLCQCHTVLITVVCSTLWSQRAWLLQPCISFSRLHLLFRAVVFSYKL